MMRPCTLIVAFAAFCFTCTGTAPADAQTSVRFVLDFLLQGQQSPFVLGREKGYYTAQKVDFSAFDPGRGGANSITKVASGTHDIGFGDLSSLIEYNAKNPGRELIAVVLIYDQAPLSLISLKKANIEKPADLIGRKGGAPSVDATYRLFNVFARVNGIDPARVQWTTVQPQVREPLLVRGEIDFAAAWVMTAVPSLVGTRGQARGHQCDDAARSRPRSLRKCRVHDAGVRETTSRCRARIRKSHYSILAERGERS